MLAALTASRDESTHDGNRKQSTRNDASVRPSLCSSLCLCLSLFLSVRFNGGGVQDVSVVDFTGAKDDGGGEW